MKAVTPTLAWAFPGGAGPTPADASVRSVQVRRTHRRARSWASVPSRSWGYRFPTSLI